MPKTYHLSQLQILVVDDNRHMRAIVRTILRGYGINQVHEADDAGAALQELKTKAIDLVITDYAMSGIDGLELIKLLRQSDDSPNPFIPIVMLTSYTERKRITSARDAGVTEFLSKPISARDLYYRIIECVARPRPFIRAKGFFGPDRRRTRTTGYNGPERRRVDVDWKDGRG